MFRGSIFGVVALAAGVVGAEVRLASPFADGMVLQRDKEVAVWGTAEAGEKVKVSFAGHEVETTADAQGDWRVNLPKLAASKESRTLIAEGRSTQIVSDVLVGEVWYCCGQSNTEMPLVGGRPHFADRQGRLVAQMTRKPFIRCAYASDYKFAGEPRKTAPYAVAWKPFTPETLGKEPSFSAMGVYFALELHSALDVPIGIIGSYWGGTNIDAWTPQEGYAAHPELKETADWKFIPGNEWTDACVRGPINGAHQQPCVLWNEMVAPWCPMTMRGFIWYQGCHNAGESARYCAKMHALYDGWSKKFENPDLKLYFVQLAPFGKSWWGLQLAQAQFAAEEKNAALVTTVDIGNPNDIHPNEKGTIGKRLAALALRHDYGFADLVAEAPTLRGICSEEGRLIMSFHNAQGWYVYQPDWGVDCGFEIAGPDGEWKKAYLVNVNKGAKKPVPWHTDGVCEGRDLILAADEVEKPMKVRYLYRKPWVGTVYADSGLPLGPFEAEVK
ncbi:MAG: sialate O-acetylesterase [Kiritimatiellia bacterium]